METAVAADSDRIEVHGLQVARPLHHFLQEEVLPDGGVDPDDFWEGFADLVTTFTPRNRELLATRAAMQDAIDDWYRTHRDTDTPLDGPEHLDVLRDLGYLVDEPDEVTLDTTDIDPEIADIAGPQLVVPVTNARYAINAANARWGSLYDALYGTDAMGDLPPPGAYDTDRGARVIAWARDFLDDTFPLAAGSHADASAHLVDDGALVVHREDGEPTGLADPDQFAGHAGAADAPTAILLTNHGLRVEVAIDPDDDIGSTDRAGVADLVMEAAVSVIMDCEDSVACVDGEDKTHAYRNWLGLQRGDLTTPVTKAGETFTRTMADDRHYVAPDGSDLVLHGRGLQLVRNVGHLMTTPAILDPDGDEVFEGLVDAMVTVACALHDLRGDPAGRRNSTAGSVYIVKPKMHGPDEVAFTDEVLTHVERVLGLDPNTVKVGIMDEERRTSANLAACIDAARHRVAFINTGFLDRTGDELHTAMEAGPMVPKTTMKHQAWIGAYEDRNVDIGLACGLRGKAQIGKGMWAAPGRMEAMLEEKVAHPAAGANCAWVPSPTAATLHAIHYHRVDVAARQDELAGSTRHDVGELLTLPLLERMGDGDLPDEDRVAELENNAQGILGYVVRWVDQGVGCSTVPDINGVGLMEDRATCRISSQALANWLHHGLTDHDELTQVFRRMALVVDEQNADDPAYTPMAPNFDGPAFAAATALAFQGRDQPSGYTEPILHTHRATAKATDHGGAAPDETSTP